MRLSMPATTNMCIIPATPHLRYDPHEASDTPRVTGGLNREYSYTLQRDPCSEQFTRPLTHCRVRPSHSAPPIQPRRPRDPPQHLLVARRNASRGHLLPRKVAMGPYGNAFWGCVSERVPGRTSEECLDGFLASDLKDTAYFHGAAAAHWPVMARHRPAGAAMPSDAGHSPVSARHVHGPARAAVIVPSDAHADSTHSARARHWH